MNMLLLVATDDDDYNTARYPSHLYTANVTKLQDSGNLLAQLAAIPAPIGCCKLSRKQKSERADVGKQQADSSAKRNWKSSIFAEALCGQQLDHSLTR